MMHFRKNLSRKTLEVTQFSGADFSAPEDTKALHAAADLANVFLDAQGQIQKRTGYQRLMQLEKPVYGIFCYEYPDGATMKRQYFVHSGTNLYMCDFDGESMKLGPCLRTDLEEKKSRGFHFGDAFYLLGAGYFKIAWDAGYKMFVCGRICKAETEDQACVLMRQCTAGDASFLGERGACIDADCLHKEMHFSEAFYNFVSGTKLYIAPTTYINKVRITDVYYTESGKSKTKLDPRHFRIGRDAKGLYVELYRADIYVPEQIYCTLQVRFCYNGFVYVPTNIINRTPSVLLSLDSGLAEGETAHYDGTLLEAYSLSNPHRATEFYLPAGKRNDTTGFRFYLEEKAAKGRVLRIYVDGVLLQSYTRDRNGHSEVGVGMYQCEYVDIEGAFLPETDCILRIEYIKTQDEFVTDACSVFGVFGGKNDTRVFMTGNPKYTGRDYASTLYDATYFPDDMYTTVGSDKSAIVGYHKISGYQVIIKDGKNFDASQYLRSYATDADGKAVFTILQGAQGIGACSASSFKNCADHMLFATRDGVYEIQSTQVAEQTNLKHLSAAVDVRLTKEKAEHAVCAVLDGKYYMSIGTQMYILDTKRNMCWYLYTDLPEILCLYVTTNELWFGAADGGIYRFMEPTRTNAYYDNVSEDGGIENARAIHAYWDIPTSTLGCGYKRKSIDDFAVYLTPKLKTSVRILYTTEHRVLEKKHQEKLGRFDFGNVDFSDFTLEASAYPVCINVRAKAKRIRVFGARIENNVPGEAMSISGIVIRYRENKEIK